MNRLGYPRGARSLKELSIAWGTRSSKVLVDACGNLMHTRGSINLGYSGTQVAWSMKGLSL